jgi:hypothetical protein
MAAGTKCKARFHIPQSDLVRASARYQELVRKGHGYVNSLRMVELEYAAAASNGLAEISAPNAVFDGSSAHKPLGLVSSDAKDTAAGAGVRSVKALTLDVDGNYAIETIATGGATVTDFDEYPKRLMHMYAASWGAEGDAAGDITLAGRGYQQLATPTPITEDTDTGLVATHVYYITIDIDGGGATEYSITTTTATTKFSALIALLNAAITGATFSIVGGDLRCTSDATTDAAAIDMTAGSSGTDLIASITGASIQTAVGSGYQECGLTGKTGATASGLQGIHAYYFKLALNGAAAVEYHVDTTTTTTTYTQLLALLNAATTGATWSIQSGDVRCTSNSALDTAAVAITAGTSGTDLLTELSSTPETAVGSGYQECGLSGKTGTTETGLVGAHAYYFKLDLNGAGVVEYNITTTTTATTFTQLLALLNVETPGATWTIEGGDVRCTSDSLLDTSAIALTAGTSGTDLLASITGCAVETAVGSGFQECGLSGKTGATASGLQGTHDYYFKLNLNGAGIVEHHITTSTTATTYTALLVLLNAETTGATWSIEGGDVRCTSDSTLDTASISITAGTSGTDLLLSLTSTPDTAVGSGYQECGLSGKVDATETGLSATTQYYLKLDLDGAGVVEYDITTGGGVDDTKFAAVIVLLNAETTGATWSLSGGDLRCTSDDLTSDASISLSAGTTGTDFFATLTGFVAVETAQGTGYQELGLAGLAGGDATGLLAEAVYYFNADIDGGGITEYSITVDPDNEDYTHVVALLNTETTGVCTWGLTTGDLRCTSDTVLGTSTVSLSAGTSGTDLFASLTGFVDFDTAGGIGYQELGLVGKAGGDATGLLAETTYYFKINIDGGGQTEENFVVDPDNTQFTEVLVLLNATTAGATWSLSSGDLRCTSDTTASTSTIAMAAGTSGTNFFASLTGFAALETAGGTGYQELGLSGKAGSTLTGLDAEHTYYFKINVDGGGSSEKSIVVDPDNENFTEVLVLLNAATTGATWTIEDGDLRCTSDTTASTSTIDIVAGTSGTDFLASLTDFSAMEAAQGIGYQEFGLTGKTADSLTGLTTTLNFYFKVNVDGAGSTEYYISTDTTTDLTYGNVITLMNAKLVAGSKDAVFSIVDDKLRCTSGAASASSAIALAAGTTGTDLFASLTGWTAFEGAVAGAVYLTIAAAVNESDGMALFLEDGDVLTIENVDLVVTTEGGATRSCQIKAARTGFDGETDPDYSYDMWKAENGGAGVVQIEPVPHEADSGAKLTFSETYIGGAESFWTKILVSIYRKTDASRGIDTRS